jgi:hypothetical protein
MTRTHAGNGAVPPPRARSRISVKDFVDSSASSCVITLIILFTPMSLFEVGISPHCNSTHPFWPFPRPTTKTDNKKKQQGRRRRMHVRDELGFFWTKWCRLNEGIFVHLCLKRSRARHMGAFPSHQTEQLDGMGWIANFYNFLGCN